MQALELDFDDGPDLLAPQAMEQQDIVDAVQELGPEMRAHHGHDLRPDRAHVFAGILVAQIVGTEVRGHDDERVAEIHRAALAVGQAPVVEHLEQHVEHIRVGLLDFVEQHDLIRPPRARLR